MNHIAICSDYIPVVGFLPRAERLRRVRGVERQVVRPEDERGGERAADRTEILTPERTDNVEAARRFARGAAVLATTACGEDSQVLHLQLGCADPDDRFDPVSNPQSGIVADRRQSTLRKQSSP